MSIYRSISSQGEGTICNVIEYGGSGGFNDAHSIVLEQTVLNLSDVQKASAAFRAVDGTQCFPFNFQFQKKCHRSETETTPTASDCDSSLPSSLAVGSLNSLNGKTTWNATGGGPISRVRYEIQAWLFRRDTVVEAVSQDIRLYDSACHAPPPRIIEHFPGEFEMHGERKIKRGLIKHAGKMTIEISEPAAVHARREHCVMQAALPIRVGISKHAQTPQPIQLRIKSTLQASTFISSTRMSVMPTSKQVKGSSCIQEVTTSAQSFTQSLTLPSDWTRHSTDKTWQQELTVEVPLVVEQTPPPSYLSPYVARRYSISVRIEAQGSGRCTFDLCVPISLLYDTGPSELSAPMPGILAGVDISPSPSMADLIKAVRPDADALPLYVR